MLDSNVYDKIVKTTGMLDRLNDLSAAGEIVILTMHVQEHQLAATPPKNEVKKAKIQKVKRTRVAPSAFLWGITPWGEAPWGSDGSEGGLSVFDVITPSGNDVEDALIASTASAEADVLVTEDARLRKRVLRRGIRCRVWTFKHLKDYILRASDDLRAGGADIAP